MNLWRAAGLRRSQVGKMIIGKISHRVRRLFAFRGEPRQKDGWIAIAVQVSRVTLIAATLLASSPYKLTHSPGSG
jgi:hypothetical protein